MTQISLDKARSKDCLLFECVTGSRAYGTEMPESDTDLRGVFVVPQTKFYGFGEVDQVSDKKNDETYYEIGRFMELLAKNNPNILEILFAASDCTRYRHPLFDLINPQDVLSKLCEATFAGYAMTQIRKARGLNKKIVNPMDGPKKSLLDFCHVVSGQGSIPVSDWLESEQLQQDECGLVKVPHMRDVYAIFAGFPTCRGLVRKSEASEVILSSIPKGSEPRGWMSFNKDGFKKYGKEYREYQDWLEKRNPARYAANIAHGKNYDSKNLMHTFRLLDMAEEIATKKRIQVRRPNREYLMQIRRGEFAYDDLISQAEAKLETVQKAFTKSDLREEPDREKLEKVLISIRKGWYGNQR